MVLFLIALHIDTYLDTLVNIDLSKKALFGGSGTVWFCGLYEIRQHVC